MTHVADVNTLKERVAKCEKNEHMALERVEFAWAVLRWYFADDRHPQYPLLKNAMHALVDAKEHLECCNEDCNQGRNCPLRGEK
jgi:hypothetical protein